MVQRKRRRYDVLKRTIDVTGAAVCAVLAAPLMAATALVIAVRLGRPILFRQHRPGRDGRIFELVKFRTMRQPDSVFSEWFQEERMTPIGSRIRAMSLDELPSLWNVLKGDMSLVGPRPLLVSYLQRYSARQSRRHEVRPGLTGLAQVSGRNTLPWDARLDLDVWYVDHRSLRLDLSILLRTVGHVLRREGISREGHATMTEFLGPMSTDRLELLELSPNELQTRLESMHSGALRQRIPTTGPADQWAADSLPANEPAAPKRQDWIALDRVGEAVSVCGLTEITTTTANVYVVVAPEHRGQGLGRETAQLLIARARGLGLEELRVETKSGDVEARRLFAGLGFRQLEAAAEGAIPMVLSLE